MWGRYDVTLRNHFKTKKAARLLHIEVPCAMGHLICLWSWAMEMKVGADGDISHIDRCDLADQAQWRGDPDEFINALVDSGFLDFDEGRLYIHDWADYGGSVLSAQEKNKEKQARFRARQKQARTGQREEAGPPPTPLAASGYQKPLRNGYVPVSETGTLPESNRLDKIREDKNRIDTKDMCVSSPDIAEGFQPSAHTSVSVPDASHSQNSPSQQEATAPTSPAEKEPTPTAEFSSKTGKQSSQKSGRSIPPENRTAAQRLYDVWCEEMAVPGSDEGVGRCFRYLNQLVKKQPDLTPDQWRACLSWCKEHWQKNGETYLFGINAVTEKVPLILKQITERTGNGKGASHAGTNGYRPGVNGAGLAGVGGANHEGDSAILAGVARARASAAARQEVPARAVS